MRVFVSLVALHLLLPLLSFAAEDSPAFAQGNRVVRTRIVRDIQSLQPTGTDLVRTARIGVLFEVDEGWHIYWQNSGEAGIPTKIEWSLPTGWRTSELRWPTPNRFVERGSITTFGYEGTALLTADLFGAPEVLTGDTEVTLRAKASWLVCREICVPGEREMEVTLSYSTSAPLEPAAEFPLFERFEALTPQPCSAVLSLPRMRDVRVHTLLSTTSVTPGAELEAGILLENIDPAFSKTIEKHIQLFPYPQAGLSVGKPVIGEVIGRDAHLISAPIRTMEDIPAAVRGILVLSSQLVQEKNDIAFEWSIPLPRAQPGAPLEPNPGFSELRASIKRSFPLALRLISHSDPAPAAADTPPPSPQLTLWGALLFAFLAGILLNLMPCVLPVVSLKVMSLVEQANAPRRQIIFDSLTFAAGILTTFVALAGFVLGFRAVGRQLVWGFAFQHPGFVFLLLFLVFILSLASFDLYTVNLPGMQFANRATSRVNRRAAKHFFDGILATALSTPCTAPFLGSAIGFAFTQPGAVTVAVFLAIGMGLALPYLVLAFNPGLARFLPSPGDWMVRVRQVMGFLLLGTALWLLFVLNNLTENGAIWALVILFAGFVLVWINGWMRDSTPAWQKAVQVCSLLLLGGSVWFLWEPMTTVRQASAAVTAATSEGIPWQPYSEQILLDERAKGNTIFIDFTAEWCITCKFNERLAINTAAVSSAIRNLGVTPVRADWTSGDPVITSALKRFGGQGVPFYVILPGHGGEPIILPTLLTPGIVIEALEKEGGTG